MEAKKKEKYLSHLLGLTIVLSFVIPHTGTALMLVSPILCVILALVSRQKIDHTFSILVVITMVISLMYNLPQGISSKSITATFSFIILFYFFPLIGKVSLSNRYLYLTLILIFISQLAYILSVPWLTRLLNTYYPVSDESESFYNHVQSTINLGNMYDFRLGGLYRNIFVTGSRTGFIVGSLVLFAYIFANKQINNIWRFFVVTISIIGFIYIVSNGSDNYRSLNLSSGSAEVKFRVFEDYITHEQDGTRFIIGYTDAARFKPSTPMMSYFDSDYGNMLYCYGLLYIFALVLFFYKVFRDMDYSGRIYLIPLLWISTAAMLLSFRHSILYMLLLSYVYMTQRKKISPSPLSKYHLLFYSLGKLYGLSLKVIVSIIIILQQV